MPILKKYYREMIIMGLVAALLASFRSCDFDSAARRSATDTIQYRYVRDTIVKTIPGPTVVRYKKTMVPIITERYDTVWSFDTDTLVSVKNDTAYLYADIPVQEYKDSTYFIRTIGWLDSLVIIDKLPKFDNSQDGANHYIMGQWSPLSYGLGYGYIKPRWMAGLMYDFRNGSIGITVGYKLQRPKLLINKK